MSGVSVKASPRYFLSPSHSVGASVAFLRSDRKTKHEKRKELFKTVMQSCKSKFILRNKEVIRRNKEVSEIITS